jgi:FkbM family methyltransferase
MRRLGSAINHLLHRAGWGISPWPSDHDAAHRRSTLLRANGIDLVIDVGANAGQYGSELRAHGYGGQIVSLEPTEQAFAKLATRAAQDERWTALRTAAGAHEGSVTMNLAANSVSSSVLPMLDRHAAAAPDSLYTGTEIAPVDRLDHLVGDWVAEALRPFLKIDVQGFEDAVLEGGAGILTALVGVELELSLVPLYDGQTLWREQIAYMESAAFRLVSLTPVFWDDASGELLAADGIFLK